MSGGSNRTSLAPSPEDQDQDGNAGNPNPDSISTDQKCTASRVKTVIKNIFAQLFSHAGLFLLVIGYSLMGAVLFRSLEGKKEEETKFEVEALRNSTLDDLYSITEKFNVLWRQNWTIEAKKKLSEFEGELFIKFQSAGYKGEGENEQWSFPGALLYAVTVISTIGKKHWLKITQKVSFYFCRKNSNEKFLVILNHCGCLV